MSPQDKNNTPGDRKPARSPSTGEGADSALDALRKKRREAPPPDSVPPAAEPPQK